MDMQNLMLHTHPVQLPGTKSKNRKGRGEIPRPNRVSKQYDSSTVLACNHCRQKKIKCKIEGDTCEKCNKLNIPCVWPSQDQRKCPSSKSHIQELYQKIAQLEAALEAATSSNPNLDHGIRPTQDDVKSPISPGASESMPSQDSDNLIARLCGRQWKLNSDEEGQFKFFGPTSSLHLTVSVSSSLLGPWYQRNVAEDFTNEDMLDIETQNHLLEVYWKYQHTVLQVFDREEFLAGMRSRQTQYFSKALLYCVYTCAARISDRPAVRALVIPSSDEVDDEQPPLVALASRLTEQELKRPQITTIQALLLLSIIQCSMGKDTKGWLLTGDACRLAIDLGLHRSGEQLSSLGLSRRDVKVRQITFWGCLVFDRLWALYLGRPCCLKSEEMQIQSSELTQDDAPWETKIAFSWVNLLMTVGRICDALNGEECSILKLQSLDEQLQAWQHNLDPELQYCKEGPASVLLLHMQYYSCKIQLHRPTANFGSGIPEDAPQTNKSREICLNNALSIATALQDYRTLYGDATTLSGISSHIIATAATILIADIAERRSVDVRSQFAALKCCVRTLSELEKTYIVARRVRRIIQLIIRLCHLETEYMESLQEAKTTAKVSSPYFDLGSAPLDTSAFTMPGSEADFANMSGYSPLCFDEFLPMSSQFDMIYSLETFS